MDDDPALGVQPMFSQCYWRPRAAEQLYESLLMATRADQTWMEKPEEQEARKRRWLAQFSRAFGTDENDESTTFNGTIPQTLMMMTKGEIGQDLTAYDSRQTVRDYLQRIGGKTASLFATACQGGAVVAQEPEEWIEALRGYGYNFGMAFQIVDDILDLTGDEAEMGKPVGSDLMQGTLTLPALILMDRYPGDNPVQKFLDSPSKELLTPAVEAIR